MSAIGVRDRLRLAFGVSLACLFAYTGYEALSFSRLARYLPLYVSVAGFGLALVVVASDLLRLRLEARGQARRAQESESAAVEGWDSSGEQPADFARAAYFFSWILGYVGLVALLGLPVASALFLALFLRLVARLSLLAIVAGVAGVLAALLLMTHFMSLRWPPSLLGASLLG